ncbi:SDR family NAD(P)-dependent oxidoreductase [Novosphingobium sp. M1R2S20]|uniref:SDR family NAD(P)-dependent oxidoreductase n=1 Tax=Novosphingobium rhizovicinum TaxID=3228928 RepID=A0ABV3RF29_9SPHN
MAVPDVSERSIAELVSLKGRVAVVTGGAQGLGRAMARRLAEAGAKVLIADLKIDVAEKAAQDLSQRYGTQVIATQLDVTVSDSIRAAADLAQSELGGLHVWVNNAGLYPNVLLGDMTDAIWDQTSAVNLRGVFVCCQEAARRMIATGTKGVLINVVSTAGFKGVAPGMAAYVATKHGVRGLCKQLAIELAPHDIRVLGVAPTFCETEGNMAALAELPERVRTEIGATLSSALGRVGVPDDIARAVLFAASDLSMFMTGSTILADAGETA